jgi:hypothetical protein
MKSGIGAAVLLLVAGIAQATGLGEFCLYLQLLA